MKTVMISIHPKWVEKIINGEKTVEVRKFVLKGGTPFKAVVYMTKHRWVYKLFPWLEKYRGKVVLEFIVDHIGIIECSSDAYGKHLQSACLTMDEFIDYCDGQDLYAWHISDLKVYDEPKELGEFRKPCIMPEMPYCPACKYGNVQYSPDEVECASDLEGASCEWLCLNSVKRPPQSYMRIEEV